MTTEEHKLLQILADYSNDLATLKKRNGLLPAEAAVEAIREWAVGVAPEKYRPDSGFKDTKGYYHDVGFNEAIDQYKRNLMGEK